eukprot:Nk52_evm3s283 gene=Nk52_evmTU3s283
MRRKSTPLKKSLNGSLQGERSRKRCKTAKQKAASKTLLEQLVVEIVPHTEKHTPDECTENCIGKAVDMTLESNGSRNEWSKKARAVLCLAAKDLIVEISRKTRDISKLNERDDVVSKYIQALAVSIQMK